MANQKVIMVDLKGALQRKKLKKPSRRAVHTVAEMRQNTVQKVDLAKKRSRNLSKKVARMDQKVMVNLKVGFLMKKLKRPLRRVVMVLANQREDLVTKKRK